MSGKKGLSSARRNILESLPASSGGALPALHRRRRQRTRRPSVLDYGWDVVRAIDTFPEATEDEVHFSYAAREGRVIVGNDVDLKLLAERWYLQRRPFRGLVWWPRKHYTQMKPQDFVDAFEELARQKDAFAEYPIIHIKPAR